MKKFSLEEKNISGMKNSYIYDIKKNSGEEDNSSNPPNLQKSTENLSKIADKDKWLKEVKGENSISEEDLEKEMYDERI